MNTTIIYHRIVVKGSSADKLDDFHQTVCLIAAMCGGQGLNSFYVVPEHCFKQFCDAADRAGVILQALEVYLKELPPEPSEWTSRCSIN